MRHMFTEIFHKFFVIVVGVAAGVGAYWYAQHHDYELWLTAVVAAAGVFVLDLLFHPFLFLMRRRRRHLREADE